VFVFGFELKIKNKILRVLFVRSSSVISQYSFQTEKIKKLKKRVVAFYLVILFFQTQTKT
jgi:hypothetical protein